MNLSDSVIRPLAAFVLAAVVANCNEGCVGWNTISPAEAYAMEVSGCVQKRNGEVLSCANTAPTIQDYITCREDAEEQERRCRSMVDKKYLEYNSNGNYPAPSNPPSAR